jgi:hypothetical protein
VLTLCCLLADLVEIMSRVKISAVVSILIHVAVVSILASFLIAVSSTDTGLPLDAAFAIKDADGGHLNFGDATIEIDRPNVDANSAENLATSATIPVTTLPEFQVAVASLPNVQSPTSESSGGTKAASRSPEGTSGSASESGANDSHGDKPVTFFGKEVQADSVAFVIDASGSMGGRRFQRAQTELIHALNKLKPEQRFFVVFYTDQTYPLFYPDNTIELIPAEQRNLGRVVNWVTQARVQGGTEPQMAMEMTLKLQPSVVFFLSDGDIPFQTQGIVRFYNRRSIVHTITFGSDVGAKIMQQIAAKNGGEYRFIPDELVDN